MKETTAQRIKRILELRGLKQIDLAIKANLPKSAISQYISGKVVPKQDKIYLLAKALDVSELWLMGLDEKLTQKKISVKVSEFTQEELEIVNKYRVLDERGKFNVRETVEREYSFISKQDGLKEAK